MDYNYEKLDKAALAEEAYHIESTEGRDLTQIRVIVSEFRNQSYDRSSCGLFMYIPSFREHYGGMSLSCYHHRAVQNNEWHVQKHHVT
jgi:hypothetical protein